MRFRRPPAEGDGSPGPVAGHEPDSPDPVWYLPTGAARGERNRFRARGWAIAVAVALLFWGVIAGAIALVVTLVA